MHMQLEEKTPVQNFPCLKMHWESTKLRTTPGCSRPCLTLVAFLNSHACVFPLFLLTTSSLRWLPRAPRTGFLPGALDPLWRQASFLAGSLSPTSSGVCPEPEPGCLWKQERLY